MAECARGCIVVPLPRTGASGLDTQCVATRQAVPTLSRAAARNRFPRQCCHSDRAAQAQCTAGITWNGWSLRSAPSSRWLFGAARVHRSPPFHFHRIWVWTAAFGSSSSLSSSYRGFFPVWERSVLFLFIDPNKNTQTDCQVPPLHIIRLRDSVLAVTTTQMNTVLCSQKRWHCCRNTSPSAHCQTGQTLSFPSARR